MSILRPKAVMYPSKPRLVLLEQPWQLARDDWGDEDPTKAARMLGRLLDYAKSMGIPVFSTHGSEGGRDSGFSASHGIIPLDLQSANGRGFEMKDRRFLDALLQGAEGPVIVGGAHARLTLGSGLGKLFRQAGMRDRLLEGLCLVRPLGFLFSLREAGLLDSPVFLDPRLTIQLGVPRMDPGMLYEVVDHVDGLFRIRPAARLGDTA